MTTLTYEVTAVGKELRVWVTTWPGKGAYSAVYQVTVVLGRLPLLAQTVGVKVTVAMVGVTQSVAVPVPLAAHRGDPDRCLTYRKGFGLDRECHLGDGRGDGEIYVSTCGRLM